MTLSDTDVQLHWIDDIATLRALEPEWQNLAERTRADVYLRPAWLSVWWNHFGSGRKLACLVLRKDGRLAGLLPFTIERLWIGPVPMRLARLAGTDPHCIVFQVPVEPEFAELAWRRALSHLVSERGCAAVSLSPVSERARHLSVLREVGAEGSGLVTHTKTDGNHIIFELTKSFDQWLEKLSKASRKKFRRDLSRLNEQFSIEEGTVVPDREDFRRFAELHARQWQQSGRGGHFSDWPGSLPFYGNLSDISSMEDPMRLYSISHEREPLLIRFGLVGGGRIHLRLPARRMDPDMERLSIGKVSLLMMIRSFIMQGVDVVEDGRGDYDYKISCGGQSVPVWRVLVGKDTGPAGLWLKLLSGWADLINLVYYRIWFLKLAPKVRKLTGGKPHPLWRGWIRSRV